MSIAVSDLKATERFYGELCGWEFRPGPQRLGPYVIALAGGVPVAGLATTTHGLRLPVAWTTYFRADSVNEAAQRIRERGATVAVGPVEFGRGRVAWAADPWGAVFAVWEGESDPGWQVGSVVGNPAWFELRTPDAFAAALFYGEVFEWDRDFARCDVDYQDDRVVLRIDGRPQAYLCGGATDAVSARPVRPRWHVYFCVEDADDAVRRALALGGSLETEAGPGPEGSPFGRVVGLRDPEGGLFSVAGLRA